jgi:hypothetical protein
MIRSLLHWNGRVGKSDSVGPNWQSGKNAGVLGVYLTIILRP